MERWRNLETKDLVDIRLDHKRVLFETNYLNTPHLCLYLQLGRTMPASQYGGKPLDVWWQLLLSWLLGGLRQLTPKYVSTAHGLFWIQLFKKQQMQETLWPSFLSPQNKKKSLMWKVPSLNLEVEIHLCLQKWRIWGRKADINKPYYFFNLLLLPRCCLDSSLR